MHRSPHVPDHRLARIPMDDRTFSRVDLHLHSCASGAATNWWVKSLGLGGETKESYTLPEDAAALVRAAGMDFVVLTDHETIEGGLAIADEPDVIVGEEVNARFPEDGTTVDVLVYGVTTTIHPALQERRDDVYRLVAYLREVRLPYVLAHPMFEMHGRLSRAAVEKRLVLFPVWEFINGSRPAALNRLAARVASDLDAVGLRQMASRQGLPLPTHRWVAGTGGSDDHAGIYGGATWTAMPRASSPRDVLEALRAGEVWPGGEDGSVAKMAHTGFKIAGLAAAERGPLAGATGGGPEAKLLEYLPLLSALPGGQVRQAITGRYEARIADALSHDGAAFPLLNVLTKVGGLVEAHLFLAPYIGVHGYYGRERQKGAALRDRLGLRREEPLRIGVFGDDLDAIHGVSTMYRNLTAQDASRFGAELTVVRCGDRSSGAHLRSIATMPTPLYRGRRLAVPSLLDVMDLIAEHGFDVLHVATPGPLGLSALIAGIALGVPLVGAYHTEFGDYARHLSGDIMLGDVVEVLVREFYERCAVVTVPSTATGEALRARGYQIGRLEVFGNGVDAALFHPRRRDEKTRERLGGLGKTLLVYAGRVSREKGLDALADAYLTLRRRRDDVHLVVVGDGPARDSLADRLGSRATFTGFLTGEDLARTLASGDVFVFPSRTDTLGRAVVEAQACGLPAVVRGDGGPRECLVPDRSGFVADGGDDADFVAKVELLVDRPELRREMGREARAFAEGLTWERALARMIALHREVADAKLCGNTRPVPFVGEVFGVV
jgi:glycosyltransferase involved in cell wall biosynthesis